MAFSPKLLWLLFWLPLLSFSTCSKDGDINLFTVEDDIRLGRQLRDQVLSDTSDLEVLDPAQYPAAYDYLNDMVDEILASDDITYAEEFPWEVYLVEDDSTLNAFAAPGGFIFVFTGLIKFLDQPDDLAGVLAHEIAHADERHSTEQLTQTYGLSTLLQLVVGNDPGLLTNVLGTLLTLKFSRSDEEEADRQSVIYLCDTPYAANGAASFFEKISAQGGGSPPEFLSTHPSPTNRVADINALADERGCDTSFDSNQQAWEQFQRSLP